MGTQEPIKMDMDFPCSSEYVKVLRLAVSGIAARLKFSYEDIENIKISISEVFTNAIQHAYGKSPNPNRDRIHVEVLMHEDKLEIRMEDFGSGFDLSLLTVPREVAQFNEANGGIGMGLTFVKNLMDDSEFDSSVGKGTRVSMVKCVA